MEPISQEFDWSNIVVLIGMIVAFFAGAIRDYFTRQKENITEDVGLKNKVSGLEKDLKKTQLDFDSEIKELEKKIEEKNNVLFKKLAGVEEKIDDKFDKLSDQIFQLVKSMNFGSKDKG